jgi:hydrogenase expression/formation protein HypE
MNIQRQCPIPINEYPTIMLAHGGGGRLTNMLIERLFLPTFANSTLESLHDGALLNMPGNRLAFATDAFTISPRFFPGGDIGSLAVHGTVNDLAMCGAQPLALAVSFILEEGLPMEELWCIVQSMQAAAQAVGVSIVTGDTKVVERNKGDGIFITTTGIGSVAEDMHIAPTRAQPGDKILLSGTIAVHGIAIMSLREGLEFETTLESDSAPLHELVARIIQAGGQHVHVLRDPTRGGVSSALNEIAVQAQTGIQLDETRIPLLEEVRGACEMLGLDPLYVANEGKCLVVVAAEVAEAVLNAMHQHPLGKEAALIGEVTAEHPGKVVMRSRIGGKRVVDMLSGEQLPRIC